MKIIYPKDLEPRNPEFNLLLLLSVNENGCEYSDFLNEKMKISESSVNRYLRKLRNELFIQKENINFESEGELNVYKITKYGLKRLDKIKSLEYPPEYPPEDFNIQFEHEEKILYMLNKNNFCVWGHFIDDRLNIPKSTLSDKLKDLQDKEYLEKTIIKGVSKPVYRILPKGRKAFIDILKRYKFDPKTIRNEIIKRIEEISIENKTFFEEYGISDKNIQYQFKKYKLLLNYTDYRKSFRSEKLYNLTLLFLAYNHPNHAERNFFTEQEFCAKYEVKEENLKHFLSELLEEELVPFKIFSLQLEEGINLYFHEKEKIGKMLKSVIEDYFEKNVNILPMEDIDDEYENKSSFTETDLVNIVNFIIDKHQIFKFNLRKEVLKFIPKYINYLAIKIESRQKKLVKEKNKLSGEIDTLEFLKAHIEASEIPENFSIEETDVITKHIFDSKPDEDEIEVYKLWENKQYSEALEVLEKSYKLKDEQYYNTLCLLLDEAKKYNELLNASTQALNRYPNNASFEYFKITALIETSQYSKIENFVVFPDYLENIPIRLIEKKQYNLAEKVLEHSSYYYPGGEDMINNCVGQITKLISKEINEKNYEDAFKIVDLIMFYNNRNPEFYKFKIELLIELKKFDEALEIVNEILKRRPKYPLLNFESEPSNDNFGYEFYLQKARILNILHRYEESVEIINKMIKLNPKIANAYKIKAISYYYLYDYKNALIQIDKAIELNPEKSIFFSIKADCLFKEDKLKDALEQIEFALKIDSAIPEYHKIKAQILLFMNKHDEALRTINRGIEKFPENPDLHETKSLVIYGNHLESLKALEKAESLGGTVSLYNKAQLFNNLGRHKEALETIEIEINEDPYDYGNYDMKAMILMDMGRFEEALKFRDKALNISGLSEKDSGCIKEQILCKYAVYLAEQNNKEKAIEVAKEAVELSGPEWASDSYEAYGDVFMIYGEYKEALDKYEKAKKSHIPSININLKIGICHFELGDYDEALKILETAKYQGEHSVMTQEVDEYGNRIQKFIPQIEIIEEAESFLSRIRKKLNKG